MIFFSCKDVLVKSCEEGSSLNHSISLKKDLPGIFKEPDSLNVLNPKMDAWRSFFKVAKDALECFMKGDLNFFDALVGENRCEIRALYFLNLMQEYNCLSTFSELLKEHLLKFKLLDNNASTKSIAIDPTLDIRVHKDIAFIIFCFALSVAKERGSDHIDRTNRNKLCDRYPTISSKLAKKLVNRFKEFVASESVTFIQRQSEKIGEHLKDYAKYVQNPYIAVDKHLLKCAPNFFGMHIVLDRIFSSSANILAIKINFQKGSKLIKQENLLFRCKLNKIEVLSPKEQKQISSNTPIYTIEGCSIMDESFEEDLHIVNTIRLIQNTDIYDIILPSFLHKTMYSGINKDKVLLVEESKILLEMLRLKSLSGRSVQDPSVFSISHVFCLTKKELFLSPEVRPPNYLPKIKEQTQA